ncbi:MAG: aldo/keto reductase [Acidimicrobiaceae bacterium]|nr:aldo/keto reductase [Acidimicrobiaceae bacterium]MCO5328549.1 aldo/keto reductase [Ilumatobacteraceae bacterium]
MTATAALGFGAAPLGNLFTEVSERDARATVDAAWDCGIRFFDTAPQYGHGLGETRLGAALAGRPRDQFTLASKVGRVLVAPSGPRPASAFANVPGVDPVFDFTRDGVLRSLEASLQRLGMDRLDIVHVHDPDDHETLARDQAFPTLFQLRDEGVIGRVGCGMNQWQMLHRFVADLPLDCVLLAGRWTLLDRSGAPLLALCGQRGVDVILGGVFNSGLLADPAAAGATFDYAAAPPELLAQARAMAATCAEFRVPLAAAAVQFAMRAPAVSTVLVGARSAEEIRADASYATMTLPDDLWPALGVPRADP